MLIGDTSKIELEFGQTLQFSNVCFSKILVLTSGLSKQMVAGRKSIKLTMKKVEAIHKYLNYKLLPTCDRLNNSVIMITNCVQTCAGVNLTDSSL